MSSRTFAYRSQDPDFLASSTREHFTTPVELAQLAQTLECQLLHLHVVRCRSRCICVVLHYICCWSRRVSLRYLVGLGWFHKLCCVVLRNLRLVSGSFAAVYGLGQIFASFCWFRGVLESVLFWLLFGCVLRCLEFYHAR